MKTVMMNNLPFFIIRRLIYSVFIILGVILLTFALFRIAAGDPARAVLGKNPSPKEVESMRLALGSGKPLLYGNWRKTELFTSVKLESRLKLKGMKISGTPEFKNNAVFLGSEDQIIFTPNFEEKELKLRICFEYIGSILVETSMGASNPKASDFSFKSKYWKREYLILKNIPKQISFSCLRNAGLKNILYERKQDSFFDSQLLETLKEIVILKKDFPFVSFFNFGRTLISKEPVMQVLKEGFLPSLSLMIPIFLGELLLGLFFAMIAVVYHEQFADKIIMFLSVAGMSVSYIVFMIAGQYFFAYYYNIFPVWGFENYKYLFLPVAIGIVSGVGGGIRFYKTIFINELKKEYLRTAVAKGCHPFKVYFKHLMKNAAVPIITRTAAILPFLFTGSLLLESFFGIPGLGFAGINALMNSDIQLLKALVIMTSILFIIINTLADIINSLTDPRSSL